MVPRITQRPFMINDNKWAFTGRGSDADHYNFANNTFQHLHNSQVHSLNIPGEKNCTCHQRARPFSHLGAQGSTSIFSGKFRWFFMLCAFCYLLLEKKTIDDSNALVLGQVLIWGGPIVKACHLWILFLLIKKKMKTIEMIKEIIIQSPNRLYYESIATVGEIRVW